MNPNSILGREVIHLGCGAKAPEWAQKPGPYAGSFAPPPPKPEPELVARIPPPPKLDPYCSDEQRVRFCFNSLVACLRGKRLPVPFLPPDITAHKQFPLWQEAAYEMVNNSVAPVKWHLYSVEAWKNVHGTSFLVCPPFKWLLSVTRIKNHGSQAEAEILFPEKLLPGQYFRCLEARHKQMSMELIDATTVDEAKTVVTKWFGGDTYQRLLVGAKHETQIAQAEINAALQRGEFLWV